MNNKSKFLIVLFLIFMIVTLQVQAKEYIGAVVSKSSKAGAGCFKPAQTTNLELNNVRAYLKTNGTMWFELGGNAQYEVPKGSGKTSLFSAAVWVGGWSARGGSMVDGTGNSHNGDLYMAAMRFGQDGNDYWTGPLNMKNATIEVSSCSYYDQFYRISRVEVERHKVAYADPDYVMPNSIKNWPAHGRSAYGESRYLAPYFDVGGDENTYEPELGDFPYYDFANELCPWTRVNKHKATFYPWVNDQGDVDTLGKNPNPKALDMPKERIWYRRLDEYRNRDNKMIAADHVLKGDETIFWFLNDKGADHSETGGKSIGLEIRVQAFAFATNDELNKMTFYSYEIINRGSIPLYDTYFSQWCDPDLGFAEDDFIGCDVGRGLGYCYNGKEIDGSGQIWAYGANPPAVGLDFFQGPYIDPDGTDNPKFEKNRANINGNPAEEEYCKRFVHHIFANFTKGDPQLLTKFYVLPGTTDTIRWNDQFAINGVNFGDTIVDNERFGMRAFTYHNNASDPVRGDPKSAQQHYWFLAGFWKNGSRFTYGGTAASAESTTECNFVFPAGTDYCNWGTEGIDPGVKYNKGGKSGNWSERTPEGVGSAPNVPGDRRFMQSAGPFTLEQGQCNYITVGVPWARSLSGGTEASIALLMVADDKCQSLFENCFKILDGPDAPDLTIREYDQKLIMFLTNRPISNNANEDYMEEDQTIPELREDMVQTYDTIFKYDTLFVDFDTIPYIDTLLVLGPVLHDTVLYDVFYRFEGYQIFQVAGPEVGAIDLENPDLARLIRQYDLVNFDNKGNPIGRLINWEFDEDLQISVPKEKVNGSNTGIDHTFEVTQDAFATGDRRLVNYKTYYFIAVAYAYNQYWPFSIDPDEPSGLYGQKLPYLRGRKTADGKSVTPISAIPHPPVVHGGGATLHSDYGSIPYITRIDGQGNGGIALDLMPDVIDKIVSGGDNNDYRVRELRYDKNAGPLNIKVIDPLRVKPFDYTLVIKNTLVDDDNNSEAYKNSTDVDGDYAYWVLMIDPTVSDDELIELELVDNDGKPIREFYSQTKIGQYYEQIIMPLGLSLTIYNTDFNNVDPLVIKFFSELKNYKYYDPYTIKYLFSQTEKIDIENDIIFADNGTPWITGLVDDNVDLPSNWIRAGARNLGNYTGDNSVKGKFFMERLEDRFFPSSIITPPPSHVGAKQSDDRAFKDYLGKFGTVCGGTWAPYVLSSPFDQGPHAKYTVPEKVPPSEGDDDISFKYKYPGNNFEYDGAGLHNYCDFTAIDKYYSQPSYNQTMTNLYSVNVVLTPDKSKWTRCVVLEACQDPEFSEGGAKMHEPRKHTSVNKDGTPDLTSKDGFGADGTEGMGWFPGYAINLETGERLNMMFSENSDESLNIFGDLINGNDMIFNPTSTYAIARTELNEYIPAGFVFSKEMYDDWYEYQGAEGLKNLNIERVWGGKHYVYVCSSSGNTSPVPYINRSMVTIDDDFLLPSKRNFNVRDTVFTLNASTQGRPVTVTWGGEYDGYLDQNKKYSYYDCGPYDEGKWLVQKFKQVLSYNEAFTPEKPDIFYRKSTKMQLFNNVMYTSIPMQPSDPALKAKWLSCDVTYKIRVTRPYLRYISRWYESPELRNTDYTVPAEYEQYKGYPVYKLSTKGLEPTFNDTRIYQSILDNINIVPNPYYGASLYERNALETMVKITNLPTDLKNNAPVTINIFTMSGILVRTLTKGDSETAFVNWDLKNSANIPVASGVYIIHVNCPGIGERMLKFFCTMRQTDLNTF